MFSFVFFVFKQKTAYELRISDWSSDVCSSDLGRRPGVRHGPRPRDPCGPGIRTPRRLRSAATPAGDLTMSEPILRVEGLRKSYRRGLLRPRETFRLEADFSVPEPAVVGVMGPNGSGKTTLFELITGSNLPSAGRVLCNGRNKIGRASGREELCQPMKY